MNETRASRGLLVFAAVTTVVTWSLSVAVWLAANRVGLAISLVALGVSLGPCLAAYALAPTRRKQTWRRAVLAAGGLSILAFSFGERTGLDLEHVFSMLLLGTMGAAIGHTIVTTMAGPALFGRLLCGWGCWRAMVLEHLPVGVGAGRRHGVWRWLPFVGLGLCASVALAGVALRGRAAQPGGSPLDGLAAVGVGVMAYGTLAVGLAFALDDRRAFCKYLCPTGEVLRWTSARSLFAIRATAERCTGCGACSAVCPMDIDVAARAREGARIGGGECILCQRCVEACPRGGLSYRRASGPARPTG
jgi:ferredoxin-type protein NapH